MNKHTAKAAAPTQRRLNPKTPKGQARARPARRRHERVRSAHGAVSQRGRAPQRRLVGLEQGCRVRGLGTALAIEGSAGSRRTPGRRAVNLGCCEGGRSAEPSAAGRGLGDKFKAALRNRDGGSQPSPHRLLPETPHSVPKGSPGKPLPLPEEGVTHLVTVT